MIAILDFEMGNVGSIANMLKVIGIESVITRDVELIRCADKLILPGVGSFDKGMKSLSQYNLIPEIHTHAIINKKPLLGICLGMQLLGNRSEEGQLSGLSLIPFECKRFQLDNIDLRVPHMGWDRTSFHKNNNILHGIDSPQRYYFVHSYYAVCENEDDILMTCEYGHKFTAAVCNDNIYGVQFHPEKSHNYGMQLLKNFAERC